MVAQGMGLDLRDRNTADRDFSYTGRRVLIYVCIGVDGMRSINLQMDGNQICATWDDFDCLAVSPAGFGNNITEAVANLINETKPYELNGIVSSIENEGGKV